MKKTNLPRVLWLTACLISWQAIALPAHAQSSAVYRCAVNDAPPTYTNNPQNLKGCEIVSGVAVTTVPAFKAPPARTGAASAASTGNPGPADFPKVDTDLQKQRDELGRRPILERELRDREERCALSRKDYSNGSPQKLNAEDAPSYAARLTGLKTQLERCDADLSAIRRELSALK